MKGKGGKGKRNRESGACPVGRSSTDPKRGGELGVQWCEDCANGDSRGRRGSVWSLSIATSSGNEEERRAGRERGRGELAMATWVWDSAVVQDGIISRPYVVRVVPCFVAPSPFHALVLPGPAARPRCWSRFHCSAHPRAGMGYVTV